MNLSGASLSIGERTADLRPQRRGVSSANDDGTGAKREASADFRSSSFAADDVVVPASVPVISVTRGPRRGQLISDRVRKSLPRARLVNDLVSTGALPFPFQIEWTCCQFLPLPPALVRAGLCLYVFTAALRSPLSRVKVAGQRATLTLALISSSSV
ncbi:unnamed protein product [Arctogadus glacialis]